MKSNNGGIMKKYKAGDEVKLTKGQTVALKVYADKIVALSELIDDCAFKLKEAREKLWKTFEQMHPLILEDYTLTLNYDTMEVHIVKEYTDNEKARVKEIMGFRERNAKS